MLKIVQNENGKLNCDIWSRGARDQRHSAKSLVDSEFAWLAIFRSLPTCSYSATPPMTSYDSRLY